MVCFIKVNSIVYRLYRVRLHSITIAQSCGDLRLVNSTSINTPAGRLEIFLTGVWGTVCSDGFGLTEARVACRQLGYSSVERIGTVDTLG